MTPAPSYPVLAPVDCGLPITPPSRVLVMPSEVLTAESYASDYQVGPFVYRGVEEENLVSMDEVSLEAPEGIAVLEEGGVELIPDSVLYDDTTKKMNVAKLRVALQACGISNNGLKTVLINRLKTVVVEGIAIIQDRPVTEIENSADDVFNPGAY